MTDTPEEELIQAYEASGAANTALGIRAAAEDGLVTLPDGEPVELHVAVRTVLLLIGSDGTPFTHMVILPTPLGQIPEEWGGDERSEPYTGE